ncbi:hypothetical protein Aperf_G00000025523 [Anoplocephala perfoliata]
MILFGEFIAATLMASIICNKNDSECIFFNFTQPEFADFSLWNSVTDNVRGGKSSASISNTTLDGLNMASFKYSLVPLPSGACFAEVYFPVPFNADSYDGVELKLKRTGENEWFKVLFMQKYSYEYFFKAPKNFTELKFPFSEFKPYRFGKRVNTTRPLDTSRLRFGIQIFGGVYEDYKQAGNGSLEIQWVKAYKN